jgi:hypothetical protein
MIGSFINILSGRDDLERIAYKEELGSLNQYLKTRRVIVPRRPLRFLPASAFTQDQLQDMLREAAEDSACDQFEPWILDLEGKKRLPVFSHPKKMEIFSKRISQQLNQVFALSGGEFLIADITSQFNVDFVELNLFCEKSWEIGVRKSESK